MSLRRTLGFGALCDDLKHRLHADVAALIAAGLIERDAVGRVFVAQG